MKRLLGFWVVVWAGLLLTGCVSSYAPPADDTAVAAPIVTVTPGGGSILVPPTLSPDSSGSAQAAPGSDTVELTMTNHSSWKVCYVYVTRPEADTWGSDWLDSDEEIDLDGTRVFQVAAGIYDLRAENCDYTALNETYQVDLNQPNSWEVTDPQVSLDEEFDNEVNWNVKGGGASGEVRSGAYYFSSSQAGSAALALPGKNFSDLDVTLEATATAPADVSQVAYGVMCRAQANGDGYLFLARGDGKVAIEKVNGGKMSALADWQATDQMEAGSNLNVVEATCQGDKLALRVNGLTVAKATDSTFQQGDVALVTLPLAAGDAEVQFDNVVVIIPN